MKYELRLHRVALWILTLLMGGYIAYSLRVRAFVGHARYETIGALFLVIVAAAAFVAMGIVESTLAFQFGKGHRRELWTYLTLGFLALWTGLYLAVSAKSSLQIVALVTSPHAFLFGLGELRISRHLKRHPVYRRGLISGGVIEILMGFCLVFGFTLSSQDVADLLMYVAFLTILQLAPFLFFQFPHASSHAE